jgi:hypothetical protein
MRVKILFFLCLAVTPAVAQTKSVTNAELEKFRQRRLQAEKYYRENYAKMGFPSPEELERQNEKSRVDREALATRLATERLQREQAETERTEAARFSERYSYVVADQSVLTGPGYYSSYPNTIYYGRRFPRVRHYNYPVRVGNGIPIVNYYGNPSVRPVRPTARWLRP